MNRFIVLLKTLSVPLFCQSSLTPLSSSHHPPKSCTNREKARCFVSKVPSRHLETLNHNLSQWEAQFVLFNAVCNCAIRYTALVQLGQRHKIDLLCLFQRIIRMNFASVVKLDNLQYDTLVHWVAWTNDLSSV